MTCTCGGQIDGHLNQLHKLEIDLTKLDRDFKNLEVNIEINQEQAKDFRKYARDRFNQINNTQIAILICLATLAGIKGYPIFEFLLKGFSR